MRTKGATNKPTKRVADIDNCAYTVVCKLMRNSTDDEFRLKCAIALLPYQKRKQPTETEITNMNPITTVTLQIVNDARP